MGKIRIINLRNYELKEGEVLIRVDRKTELGNPFIMNGEDERNIVCEKYKKYFYNMLDNKQYWFIEELKHIYKTAKRHDVALGCWCHPKRCHAEIIRDFIYDVIDNDGKYKSKI